MKMMPSLRSVPGLFSLFFVCSSACLFVCASGVLLFVCASGVLLFVPVGFCCLFVIVVMIFEFALFRKRVSLVFGNVLQCCQEGSFEGMVCYTVMIVPVMKVVCSAKCNVICYNLQYSAMQYKSMQYSTIQYL